MQVACLPAVSPPSLPPLPMKPTPIKLTNRCCPVRAWHHTTTRATVACALPACLASAALHQSSFFLPKQPPFTFIILSLPFFLVSFDLFWKFASFRFQSAASTLRCDASNAVLQFRTEIPETTTLGACARPTASTCLSLAGVLGFTSFLRSSLCHAQRPGNLKGLWGGGGPVNPTKPKATAPDSKPLTLRQTQRPANGGSA